MGWLLLNNGSRQRLRLKPGTVLIGRAQQAHIRPNHQSVSRGHAEILVEVPADGNLQEVRPYPIYLIDRSSSQLTFVNATPSGVGIRKPLQPGDTVTFGVDPVNFSLQWAATVLSCSSRMKPPEVTAIQGMARTAGVFLTTEWADGCTHLLMDQLAITPKLLCCIVDGGVPVAASYLQALAACDQAGQAPEPIHHQPLAPAGADATYAEELQNCARAPRPRHDLLKGVWIIYAARGTCEGLSKALTSAGARDALNAMVPGTPPTPFVCSSIQDVASVAAALTKSREQVGAPDEIWLVPGLEEEIVSALAGTLLALGARECRAVPLQAMVSGILKGDKSSVCAGASRVTLSKTSPDSYPDTAQHQALRPAQISAKVDDVKVAAAVKDETFPHTQEQPGLPPVITGKRQEQEPPAREAAAKRQKIDMPEPAVPSTGRYEASAVKFSNSQEPLPKPDVSAGMAHTVSSYGRPKSELAGIGAPLTVSSDGGLKKDADKLKVEAGGLAPVSVISSLGGPSQGHRTATQDGSGMPKILSINFDTPMTQPKPEVQENREVISEPVTKIELKAKVEAPAPAPVPQPAASASASGAVGGQIVLRTESSHVPVKHPNGVWLTKTVKDTSKQEPFVLQYPGLGEIDICRLRATTTKGAVIPTPARPGLGAQAASRTVGAGSERRNFKMFSKSMGQQKAGQREFVPIMPWAPTPGPGLAEAFASHRIESESQLPPV